MRGLENDLPVSAQRMESVDQAEKERNPGEETWQAKVDVPACMISNSAAEAHVCCLYSAGVPP